MIANVNAGFYINGKHTYDDYGLYLSSPPDFGIPEPKVQTVEIAGMDGYLDFTEAAMGEVNYGNRQMEFVFAAEVTRERREALRSELMNDIHGKVVEIVYDYDADWTYTGRASVSFNVQAKKMKVVISVDAKPYKMAAEDIVISVEPTDFGVEFVKMAQAPESQRPNSNFLFGTKYSPQLDLTEFTKLVFESDDSRIIGGVPRLYIADGNGAVYSTTLSSFAEGSNRVELLVSQITGIDKSQVYRVLCSGRSLVKMSGYTVNTASVTAIVDRMTVVPTWSSSAPVKVIVNGNKFEVASGITQNYKIRLKQGENTISFLADSDEQTVTLSYRNGRL